MSDEPTYADLRTQAKDLGITSVGLRREELEAAIARKLGVDEPADPADEPASSSDATSSEDAVATAADPPPARASRAARGTTSPVPEPVGSAGRVIHWNCSAGDLDGATEDEVLAHIADVH